MAFQALGWLQKTIGIDITGESEFQENMTTVLHKKADEPTPEIKEEAAPPRKETMMTVKSVEAIRTEDSKTPRRSSERRHRKKHASGDKSLMISPSKFYFPLPLDKYIMNTLNVVNTTDGFMQFKVKATAPARYAVKPRQGVLGPREQLEIHVTLRPTKDDPSEMRDKFLIQYRSMNVEEVTAYQATGDLQAAWQGKKDISGTKIRCKFTSQLPPNFIVKSVVDHRSGKDDDTDDELPIASFEDDEEEGEILPERSRSMIMQHRRHHTRTLTQYD